MSVPDLTWEDKLAYITYHSRQRIPQVSCPLTHIFKPQIYIKEMFIPQGTFFIGRPHVFGHRLDLLSGRVVLISERGRVTKDPPYSMHTQPGFQMALYAVTDVVGRAHFPNPRELRDIQVLEDVYFSDLDDMVDRGEDVHKRIKHLEYNPQLVMEQEFQKWSV